MKIHKGYSDFKALRPVVTLGMFDGVHRGHMSLINRVLEVSRQINGESVAISFEPHPRIVLSGGDESLRFLSSLEEKISLLEKAGIDHLIILPFTREFSRLGACDFVRNVLSEGIGSNKLIVGYDHQFGRDGSGSSKTIGECASKFGFTLERVDAFEENGISVSSSEIRKLIQTGNLKEANSLLGYEYFLHGSIIKGMRIGRAMGYPTANLLPDYNFKLIPDCGVYAGEVKFEGSFFKAMIYIGTRPTISEADGNISIEAHLLNYEGDLYGRPITVYFKHRLRADIKFSNKKLLRDQIDKDKEDTIRLLGD